LAEKQSVEEMAGIVLRDLGALIIVFFPLEEWGTWHVFTFWWVSGSLLVGIGLVILGMILERKRGE